MTRIIPRVVDNDLCPPRPVELRVIVNDRCYYLIDQADLISVAITLDEDAVCNALPEGVEPVEGMTGGFNRP